MAKTKPLDCKNIYKYINIYQMAYNKIYDFTTKDLDFSTKKTDIFLQVAMFLNIENLYAGIVSTIKSE